MAFHILLEKKSWPQNEKSGRLVYTTWRWNMPVILARCVMATNPDIYYKFNSPDTNGKVWSSVTKRNPTNRERMFQLKTGQLSDDMPFMVHMSRLMTKPTKWHVHPAKTQISLGICSVWSESSLCAQWVAKDPSFLHPPSLIRVFAGRTCYFVGFVIRRLIFDIHVSVCNFFRSRLQYELQWLF